MQSKCLEYSIVDRACISFNSYAWPLMAMLILHIHWIANHCSLSDVLSQLVDLLFFALCFSVLQFRIFALHRGITVTKNIA